LKESINSYFQEQNIRITLKYSFLGRSAVHAGISGKTKMLVGLCNNQLVHIPMEATAGKRKQVNLSSDMWMSVLETTGQTTLKN